MSDKQEISVDLRKADLKAWSSHCFDGSSHCVDLRVDIGSVTVILRLTPEQVDKIYKAIT